MKDLILREYYLIASVLFYNALAILFILSFLLTL